MPTLQKLNCQTGEKNLDLVKLNVMKRLISYGAVVFCTLVILISCTKSSSDNFSPNTSLRPDRIINAKILPGQLNTIFIDNTGELSIAKQASHFKISETGIDPKNSSLIYSYAPADGFSGNDEVLLAHKTESSSDITSSGSCNYNSSSNSMRSNITYIAIKISVGQ